MPALRLALLLVLVAAALPAQARELRPMPPRPAPPLALADLAGRTHDLAEYRGRVVLLNFWATWCIPCRTEMPSLERLHRQLDGKPFAILAVDMAEPRGEVEAFLREVPVSFPVLLDARGAAARQWRLQYAPVTYIIDAEGRIRYSQLGGMEWDDPQVVRQIVELLPPGS